MVTQPSQFEARKLADYAWMKARFVRENPNATLEQYERYVTELERRVGITRKEA